MLFRAIQVSLSKQWDVRWIAPVYLVPIPKRGVVKLTNQELSLPQDMGRETAYEYSIWRLGISATS